MSRAFTPPLPPQSGSIPAPSPAPLAKALAAIGLFAPFALHGATITVATTADESASICTLRDAARAINSGSARGGCPAGSLAGPNTVNFAPGVNGVISYGNGMDSSPVGVFFAPSTALNIVGPSAGSLAINCTATGFAGMAVVTNVAADVAISGLTIRNCSLSGNNGLAGGLTVGNLLSYYFSNTVGNVQLSNLVITGNSGSSLAGGLAAVGNNVNIRRSSFEGNSSSNIGGVGVAAFGSATMSESLVSGNTGFSNTSAVVSAVYMAGASVTLDNSTISGNQVLGAGAGYDVVLVQNTLNLSHSTIVRNTQPANTVAHVGVLLLSASTPQRGLLGSRPLRPSSSNVVAASTAAIHDSIICGNPAIDLLVQGRSNVIADYNLLGVVSGPVSGTGNVMGCTAAQLNSWLGPLANNGGPTRTHALLNVPGNPAINGGDPAYGGTNTDQRGALYQRVVGGRTDMGAYEFGAGLPTEVPTTGGVGLGALSLALAALGARRRKAPKAE